MNRSETWNIILKRELLGSKWYHDENRIFPFEAILKHKKITLHEKKNAVYFFKYLFLFERYSSF